MQTDVLSMVLAAVVLLGAAGPAAAATDTATASSTADTITGPTAPTVQPANCSFPTTATDATGTEVTVETEPGSVVTLSPSAAQTMWEIGAREKVVGLTQYADYLDGAETRTNVSGAGRQTVNVEEVVGLNPDLVLAPYVVSNETVQSLRNVGLTVFKFEAAGSIEDVYEKTRLTGRLVGACAGGDRIATAMETRVETIRQAVDNQSEPSVLYYLGGSFVAGNDTFIGSLIETAGGDNLAANAGIEGFAEISEEVIANRSVEWIVVTSPGAIPNGTPWSSTIAVQQNQTIVVSNDYINQPAPRVVFPLTEIARNLHPDAIKAANLTNSSIGPANLTAMNATAAATDGGNATATGSNETAATTAGTTPTETGATPADTSNATMTTDGATTAGDAGAATTNGSANGTTTSSGTGPGFGPAVAVIAVLAGTVLAVSRRRL